MMVSGGISMKGHTDPYRLDRRTLTSIRSLDPFSDHKLGQWILGSSWCTTILGLMWQEYAGNSRRMSALRSGRRYPRTPSVISLEACPGKVRNAYKHMGPYQLLTTILSCCSQISAKLNSLLHNFLHFDFQSVFDFSSLYDDNFHFHQCGILSFLIKWPVHISIDIQHVFFSSPSWNLMYFQSVPLSFLSSVFEIKVWNL